ncbi:MAG: DinB family protein [Phycisphaerae bacterium]|nr:DinB family protein [Phycisphaerae bacterium]
MAAAYPGAPNAIPEILAMYERQIVDLESMCAELSPQQYRARPVPGKWSTLELLCHLADSEMVWADRIKRTIALPNPMLLAYDEMLYVNALAYEQRDPAEELAVIRATRMQTARILSSIKQDAWERTAVHSERGITSVKDIAQTAIGHTHHHLPFLLAKRTAMGLR